MDSRGYGRTAGLAAPCVVSPPAPRCWRDCSGVCVGRLRTARRGHGRLARRCRAARRRRRAGARRPGARRPPRRAHAATAPTRGARPEWLVAGERAGRRRWSSSRSSVADPVDARRPVRCRWPAELPLLAAPRACSSACSPASHAPHPPGRPVHEPSPARPEPAERGRMIRFEHVSVHVRRRRARRRCATSTWTSPEGELVPRRRRAPGRASRRCSARSNGLVPHFTGGTLSGRVTVAGRDTRTHPRRASSPTSSASSARTRWPGSSPTWSRTSSRTAWSRSACRPTVMRRRVEETLDLLGLADAARPPAAAPCPAAQRQRVAIGVGAHRAPAGAGARRADLGARSRRGRGGAGRAAAPRARPRHHRADEPSTAWSGSCSTPTASSCCPAAVTRRASATGRAMMADSPRRAAGRGARPAGRLVTAAAVGARRPPGRGTPARSCWPRLGVPARCRRPGDRRVRATLPAAGAGPAPT